ncbi:MAG: hypothetical protein A4E20_01440 [Nitrospira sp. SG-bin2]|uniref:hypothetical protein n=1 Tax=Nitrospira cf. moscoviensis SBR1015 TaxID=96242 RepID=UPI000A0CF7CD|nr:hypothetical protein [Nitrospira cf. moscoviensis SBR1015]OQW34868.1 MAG: hypothetical protein A4E20_01440 [Nitrospira sp. SG-bin2]
MADALMTEVEAVNIILGAIGEAPVNNLSGTLPVDVTVAVNTLYEVRRSVQETGWNFNTEYGVQLSLDGSNNIQLGNNVLRVELTYPTSSIDVVQRGTRLYDKLNHTYVFQAAPKLNIVYFLAWDELPQQARSYIALSAARKFQARNVGSPELDGYTARDEAIAFAALKSADGDSANHNIFDSYDMNRLYRYRRRY